MTSKGSRVAAAVSVASCFPYTAMLIVAFVFVLHGRRDLAAFADSYKDFIANWDQDMVFDLSLSSSPNLARFSGDYYVSPWASNWPGNNPGCHCKESAPSLGVTAGVHIGFCNFNQTDVGCTAIPAGSSQALSKVLGPEIIYAVRGKGTNFLESYRRMDSRGKCRTGYRRCGNPNSKSTGLCIANTFKGCPLTDIRTTEQATYSSLTLSGGAKLHFASTDTANSISDLMVVQHHACFIRSHLGYTPGRSIYELLHGNYVDCREDKLLIYLHEVGEQDLLARNQVSTSKLTGFVTSNNFKYKMAAARYIDWSLECWDTVEPLLKMQKDLANISREYLILFILYVVSFPLSAITILVRLFALWSERTILYKQTFSLRLIFWVMVVPSCFICLVRIQQFSNFFLNIAELGCSDSDTNSQFLALGNEFKDKLSSKIKIVIILTLVEIFIEICVGVLDLCFLPKEPAHTSAVLVEPKPEETVPAEQTPATNSNPEVVPLTLSKIPSV